MSDPGGQLDPFRLAVVNTRTGRPQQYTLRLNVTGPQISSMIDQIRCTSCGACPVPLRPGLDDADVSVLVEHAARCAGFLDFLGGRDQLARVADESGAE